jgi:anti-sigma factor RsiW
VTKADEGVAPVSKGAAHVGMSASVRIPELTHDVVRDQLSEYLDGSLGDGDRRRIEQHVRSCRSCAAFLATLRTAVEALHELPPPVAPSRARAKILDHVREQARQQRA